MLLRTKLIATAVAGATTIVAGVSCLEFDGTKYNPDFAKNATVTGQATDKMTQAANDLNTLGKNIDSLQKQLATAEANGTASQKEIQKLQQQIAADQKKANQIKADEANQQQQIVKDQESANKAKAAAKAAQAKATDAQNKVDQLKNQLDNAKSPEAKQQLQKELDKANADKTKADADAKAAQAKATDAQNKLDKETKDFTNYYKAYIFEYGQVKEANDWAAQVDKQITGQTTELTGANSKLTSAMQSAQQYLNIASTKTNATK